MTGLGSNYASVESAEKMNANLELYLSRSSSAEAALQHVSIILHIYVFMVNAPTHYEKSQRLFPCVPAFWQAWLALLGKGRQIEEGLLKAQRPQPPDWTLLYFTLSGINVGLWDVIMNAKPSRRHLDMREGQRRSSPVKEDNSALPLSLPFPLILHRGNGFSDLCLPITVCFTQHQPSDGITHQHRLRHQEHTGVAPSPDSHHHPPRWQSEFVGWWRWWELSLGWQGRPRQWPN